MKHIAGKRSSIIIRKKERKNWLPFVVLFRFKGMSISLQQLVMN